MTSKPASEGKGAFAEMRRQDRALTQAEAEELLRRGEYGVLTVNGANGYPHPVPVSYAYQDGALWIHCATAGTKLDAARADARAAFCVVGATEVLAEKFSTRYESVIVYGRAAEAEGEAKQAALVALVEKYSPEHRAEGLEYIERARAKTCVLRLEVERITGKARR